MKEGEIFSALEWNTIYGDSFFQCQLPFILPFEGYLSLVVKHLQW